MNQKLRIRYISHFEGRPTIMFGLSFLGLHNLIEIFDLLSEGKGDYFLVNDGSFDKDFIEVIELIPGDEDLGFERQEIKEFQWRLTPKTWGALSTKLKNKKNNSGLEFINLNQEIDFAGEFQIIISLITNSSNS